jgi:hypothetical protein
MAEIIQFPSGRPKTRTEAPERLLDMMEVFCVSIERGEPVPVPVLQGIARRFRRVLDDPEWWRQG